MKQFRLPIFTSKIKIYNLRIVPHDPIYGDVMLLKEQFENIFGKQPLSRSKTHITIATFRMNAKHEEVLLKVFNELSSIEKFRLRISGFGISEKNSNALHLKVTKSKDMERLHSEVHDLYTEHLGGKLKSFTTSNIPHINISKTTGKKMLHKSLAHFQKIGYSNEIEVGHLVLVSRSKYKTWDWEHRIELS